MSPNGRILVVDDTPQNIKLLDALLTPRGYEVIQAASGEEALAKVGSDHPDLVLLDIVMPGMDGYEVCRRLRADEATALLPVVMITASGEQEKVSAIDAGADDFITKPLDQAELLARIRSLIRIKQYHDQIEAQSRELERWNNELEERVRDQVQEVVRLGRLKRFLAPQLADLIVSSGDESFLESHRREITVVFCDLRGFTSFAESGEPEDVMGVLREYHTVLGELIFEYEGTLERFTGDGLMVFFNDPVPCDDPAARAVRMSLAMQDRVGDLVQVWQKRGYQLHLGIGIAQGYATLGRVGFEGRFDYAAIGTVTNLAARLCDRAEGGQILISQRVFAETEDLIAAEAVTEISLKGFSKPVGVYTVVGLKGAYAGAGDESAPALDGTKLADLSEDERSERFADLQRRLGSIWGALRSGHEGESIVVIPSRTVDKWDERAAESQAYEERLLFLLLLLRQPRLRVIYVTSLPIAPSIIDYYLGMLAGVIPAHARARLSLVATHDGSARPLSAKLLERPRVIEQIRRLIPDPQLCHLVPYTTSALERDLALLLGIPMYGADPRFLPFGTKTGCRRLFSDERVSHPFGREEINGVDDVVDGLMELHRTRPAAEEALVKLNEGVSGEGNSLVDLRGLPAAGSPEERAALEQRIREMSFEVEDLEFDTYLEKLRQMGGVLEERISGSEFRSPSVQLRVTPVGEVQLLSTHDQLLGGPSGQSYLGCVFPADRDYAAAITAEARKIGDRLAREGVLGRFAVDFVVVRDGGGEWTPYAIEINLRKGGTTHPYLTLEFLTEGHYDPDSATFLAPSGQAKFLVASDHLESSELKGLTHEDLFDVIVRRDLHFDQARQRGVVFHMMSALTELGRIGVTAVGDSPEEAEQVYREAESALLDEGRSALTPPTLPAP